ncbi:MAG: CDP-diacylglycerol--serine O-phosphatidyltransferase [Clostridia bacterium]|jgi:CDP-diacylglycerol--serine O-phosphatidyltransferase|nr:CDP-diacylglycerol--serine O-phosphatidyltransferase [Clostridia bacterium]
MFNKLIPNIFTLANLFLGFLALIYTMEGLFQLAASLILVSVVLDGLDGKVARKLGTTSNFGKELDSLADLVSFGVAPAILIYAFILQPDLGIAGLFMAVLFALCGAVRLARFNTLNITTHFLGVPITVAGGIIALVILVGSQLPGWIFALITLSLAFLMVSSIKLPKF